MEVWNKYFAPVMGVKDSPILAIYSHMVEVPLYLPNYAYGQIIENQVESYIADKKFSDEVDRIFKLGKLTPQQWMKGATGKKISAQPIIEALNIALEN
jgi:oligoendopeptidase F